jgi:hypothetical protein
MMYPQYLVPMYLKCRKKALKNPKYPLYQK